MASAAQFRELLDRGLSIEHVLAAVEVLERDVQGDAQTVTPGALRMRKLREKRASSNENAASGDAQSDANGDAHTVPNAPLSIPPSESTPPTGATSPCPPKKTRASPKTRLDEAWEPDPAYLAKRSFTAGEIEREIAKFRNHHIAKGTLSASWPRSWQTWCINADEYRARNTRNPRRSGPASNSDRFAAAFDRADEFFEGATVVRGQEP